MKQKLLDVVQKTKALQLRNKELEAQCEELMTTKVASAASTSTAVSDHSILCSCWINLIPFIRHQRLL